METKKKKKKNNEEERDRISSLSDDVLLRILSLLNAKGAVQTSVFSKRWKTLFKSLRRLDFDYLTIPFSFQASVTKNPNGEIIETKEFSIMSRRRRLDREYREEALARKHCFSKFINQVLLNPYDPTNLIKVCFSSPETNMNSYSKAGYMIKYTLKDKVEELFVNYRWLCDKFIEMPDSFYSCESMTTLKLEAVNHPSNISHVLQIDLRLPALKSLHLVGFIILKGYDRLILSGCPNLETLKLVNILFIMHPYDTFRIDNALNMKNLEISIPKPLDFGAEMRKIVIDAPRLTTFRYHGYALLVLLSANNFGCLDQVYFDTVFKHCYYHTKNRDYKEKLVLDLINGFKEVSQAKSLTLSSKTIEDLSEFPALLDNSQLEFPNLKSLKVLKSGLASKDFVVHDSTVLNHLFSSSTFSKILKELYCAS